MIKQNFPIVGVSSRDIYETCANGFRDADKVKKLLKYGPAVEDSSNEFLTYIPSQVDLFPDHPVDESDKSDIISIYDQKFAKASFMPGRRYYDVIRNSTGGVCAICNIGVASTLDHYLPKSIYPLLCVCPENLVPECSDCNKNKLDHFNKNYSQIPLHPFLDDFTSTQWLDVKLYFTTTVLLEYYNSFVGNKDTANRITITIENYKLDNLFSIQANSDIANNICFWKEVMNESGKTALQDLIRRKRKSCERFDINSWSAALYRAIERQYDEFVVWLELQ